MREKNTSFRNIVIWTAVFLAAVLGGVFGVREASAAVLLQQVSSEANVGDGPTAIIGQTFLLPDPALIASVEIAGGTSCAGGFGMGLWEVNSPAGDLRQNVTLLATSNNIVFPGDPGVFIFSPPAKVEAGKYYFWGAYIEDGSQPPNCGFNLFGARDDLVAGEAWKVSGNISDPANFNAFTNVDINNSLPNSIVDLYEIINGETEKPILESVGQFRQDGTTQILEDEIVAEGSVVFKAARITSPLDNQVKLQVELREKDESFTGSFDGGILETDFLSSGSEAVITRTGLLGGFYRWRSRAVDAFGNATDWQEFGEAGNVDFIIGVPTQFSDSVLVSQTSFSQSVSVGNPNIVGQTFIPKTEGLVTQIDVVLSIGISGECTDGMQVGLWKLNSKAGDLQQGAELLATSTNAVSMPGLPDFRVPRVYSFFFPEVAVDNTSYYFWGAYTDVPSPGCSFAVFGETSDVVFGNAWDLSTDENHPADFETLAGLLGYRRPPLPNNVFDFYEVIYATSTKLQRDPVIIVPGIMGSRLNRVSDGEEVWPNTTKMFSPLSFSDDYLDELKLDGSGGEILDIDPPEVIKEESFVFVNHTLYGNLIDNFLDQGYASGTTLFTVPYDWRLDIREEIDRLDNVVQQAMANSPTGKVDIIAHSMGGLLVKEYLLNTTTTDFADKVIFAGTPQLGSPKTLKLLNYGDDLNLRWFIFGLNPDKAKEISQNMPAVYQLLPGSEYVQDFGPYVFDFRSGSDNPLTYAETTQFMVESGRNPTLLELSSDYHLGRDGVGVPVGEFYNIVGCRNVDTIGAFRIYDDETFDLGYVDGDGTVPLVSANSFASTAKTYFADVDHSDLVRADNALLLINSILEDNPLESLGGISQDVNTCINTENRIVFSSHSPVVLHVYDSEGRHLGPTEDGSALEFDIPESSYEEIEGNRFAGVPVGDTYLVVLDATDSGEFSLEVNLYGGTQLTDKVVYLDVPLPSAQTNVELIFSGTTGDFVLDVDNNGDGIIDTTIQPTAVLSGAEAGDVLPPTTAFNTPSEVILNAPLTIDFDVTDDSSGVAIVEPKLDGIPVSNGEVVLAYPVGRHNLEVKAVDRAGNPNIETIGFDVIYQFLGFLPPLSKQRQPYNPNQTLPVKFRLGDYNGDFIGTAHAELSAINSETGETLNIGVFRYDNEDKQYIFNFNLGLLGTGEWMLRVSLDDGKSYEVDVSVGD